MKILIKKFYSNIVSIKSRYNRSLLPGSALKICFANKAFLIPDNCIFYVPISL